MATSDQLHCFLPSFQFCIYNIEIFSPLFPYTSVRPNYSKIRCSELEDLPQPPLDSTDVNLCSSRQPQFFLKSNSIYCERNDNIKQEMFRRPTWRLSNNLKTIARKGGSMLHLRTHLSCIIIIVPCLLESKVHHHKPLT